MAKRRGGFGGQGTFANAGPGGGGGGNAFNRGPSAAPAPAPMRAGGGNNRNRNNPFNNRQQRRRQQQRRGGGTDAPADDGSGDSTDSQTAADAFQGIDYRPEATWAYLGGAGIRNDNPMGANATNWLTNRVASLATDYQGKQLLNPDLTYNDYLNQTLAGQQAAAPVAAAPAPVNDPNTQFHTMGGNQGRNRRRRLRMLPHQGGPEPAPVPAPSAGTPVGVPTDPAAVRALLMRDYESTSPLGRGADSRSYRAPRRVVQF